jgi:hypothetical protein
MKNVSTNEQMNEWTDDCGGGGSKGDDYNDDDDNKNNKSIFPILVTSFKK